MKRFFTRFKLYQVIFYPLLVVLMASLVLLALNGYKRTHEATMSLTSSLLERESSLLKEHIENQFNHVDKALFTLSHIMQKLPLADQDWVGFQLEQWSEATEMPVWVLSAKGEMYHAESKPFKLVQFRDASGLTHKKYAIDDDSPLAETTVQTEVPVIWQNIFGRLAQNEFAWVDDGDYFYIAYRVNVQADNYLLLGSRINKKDMTRSLQSIIDRVQSSSFYILDSEDHTLLKTPQSPSLATMIQSQEIREHLYIRLPLELNHDTEWALALTVPSRNLVAPIERSLQGTLLQTMLILVGITFVILMLAIRLGRPLNAIRQNAKLLQSQRYEEMKPANSLIEEYRGIDESLHALKNRYEAIQRYVPTPLIERITDSKNTLEVHGEMKTLTLFNVDIQHYCRLSQKFSVEQIVYYLSSYHSVVYDVINQKKGIVDRFESDRVFAYWGAPVSTENDILFACQAAMEVKKQLDALNERLLGEGFPQLKYQCNLYRGEAVVGNFGSQERMVYTAIGGSVNESQILNRYNAQYGTQTIVCEKTYEAVKDVFFMRKLDVVTTEKYPQGLGLYELICWQVDPRAKQLQGFVSDYEKGLTLLQSNQLDAAETIFMDLTKKHPEDQAVVYQLGMVYQLKQNQLAI